MARAVLIVEDDQDQNEMLAQLVLRRGFQVVHSRSIGSVPIGDCGSAEVPTCRIAGMAIIARLALPPSTPRVPRPCGLRGLTATAAAGR